MTNCEVQNNCLNKYDCDFCENYQLYKPINKKIKCKRQIEEKENKKRLKKEKRNTDLSRRGRANRRKGKLAEKDAKQFFESLGLKTEKVPLSGALKDSLTIGGHTITLSSDLRVEIGGEWLLVEVKRRNNINTFYKMVEFPITHIEGFCYVMEEEIFRGLLNGLEYEVRTVADKKFKTLHTFFDQDKADIVVLKSPYKPHIICLREEVKNIVR